MSVDVIKKEDCECKDQQLKYCVRIHVGRRGGMRERNVSLRVKERRTREKGKDAACGTCTRVGL